MYGEVSLIVFDGYDNISIRYFEQSRRRNSLITESEGVRLNGSPPMQQNDSLKHIINKASLLKLLIPYL